MITVGSWLGRALQDVPAHIIPYHHTQEYHTIIPKNNMQSYAILQYLTTQYHIILHLKIPNQTNHTRTYPVQEFPAQIITPALITTLPHLASFHSSTISFIFLQKRTLVAISKAPSSSAKGLIVFSLQLLARARVQSGPWPGQANRYPDNSSSPTPMAISTVIDIVTMVHKM